MLETPNWLLKHEGPFIVPGVYDALSAKLVERAGFRAAYLSSHVVSVASLCLPDFELVTMSETVNEVRYMRQAVKIPIIIDGEAGYGNALIVKRFIEELEMVGGSGTDLQDQRLPRIHYSASGQKELVPLEEHAKKIRAAVEARKNHGFLIIGRTEAANLDEAIRRLKAYVESGADMIFPHSIFSISELERMADTVKMPMIINYPQVKSEGLHRPTVAQLTNPNFRMVLFPLSLLHASANAVIRALELIKKEGTDAHCDMARIEDLDEVIDASRLRSWLAKYLPSAP